ncbi:MAG: ABC transporter permease [Candidatus Altiarchaeota archaeon]|nr:ABC transporter permease [Candidatus Altiarchaeota archaeon]
MKRTLEGYLSLIWGLSMSEFKLRYRGSVLGFLWSLLNPLFILLTLYVVFHVFMNVTIPNYELYLLLGIVLWNFFARGTMIGLTSIVGRGSMIKKVYFPREIVVLSLCLTELYTTICTLAMFFVILLVLKPEFSYTMLLFPLVILKEFLLILGISLGLSALYVYYRDIVQIWDVVLQAGFWVTPIVYSLSIVPEKYLSLYMLNPIAIVIVSSRDLLIYQTPSPLVGLLAGFAYYIAIFAIGYFIFHRLEPRFAEEV